MTRAMRILVADDNVQVLGLVGSILRSAGYEVTACEGGGAAVEAARETAFDLILLDGMMPDLDGFEVCEYIRRIPRHRHTPVVFLTGMTDDSAFEDAIEVGADEVLPKPIRRSTLLMRVRSLLRVGQLLNAQNRFQEELGAITQTLWDLKGPLRRTRDASTRLAAEEGPSAELASAVSELEEGGASLHRAIDGMAVIAPGDGA